MTKTYNPDNIKVVWKDEEIRDILNISPTHEMFITLTEEGYGKIKDVLKENLKATVNNESCNIKGFDNNTREIVIEITDELFKKLQSRIKYLEEDKQ